MKIAYIGNFKPRHSTETHIAATLEDLGHEVYRVQEDGPPDNWFQESLKCNLILYTRTWGNLVTNNELFVWREHNIPTASYHLDLYVGLSRKLLHGGKSLEEVLQTDPFWRTDYVFTPDGDPESAKVFESNGVSHYYMKPGVFKPECYMDNPHTISGGLEYVRPIDVLFVGGGDWPSGGPNGYGHPEWPYRDQLIGWLRGTYGNRFTKFGHPQKTIRNEELNHLYADSKVVVGDSVCIPDFKHSYYWSDRVYETLGRGGFLIHPYIKGMEEEFKDGEHLVYYEFGNFSQLKEKIDYYLSHDEEREYIRSAGHKFVKEHATYHNRLNDMLNRIAIEETAASGFYRELVATKNSQITPAAVSPSPPIKISLGAGTEPEEGFVNVDIVDMPGIDVVHNLMHFPYPFEDGSAEYIKAKDLIEHLATHLPDGRNTLIAFIEECHRILKPGGTLWIQTPAWDADFLWIDPSHVRGYDIRSMDFFDPDTDFGRSTGFYSPAKFKVSAERLENGNLQFTMVRL